MLSQILLPIAAPFIDLAAVWALFTGTRFPLVLWLMVGLMQLGAAAVALRMEGQSWRGLLALPLHLFGYRQVTSFVVIQTVAWAVAGRRPGWGAQPVAVLSEYGDPDRADVDAPVVAPGVGPSDATRGRDPVRRAA